MTTKNNAARVAVQAEPCPKLAYTDCSAVFGVKHPEDVIAPIHVAQEHLNGLEQLFAAIADDPKAGYRAKRLAEMGRFVAQETSDYAAVAHEDMLEAIKKGGAA